MIRRLNLTDNDFVNGLGISETSTTARHALSDYLYLVADCLTVVFQQSESLGLSDVDLMLTANRYLNEARQSLASTEWDGADCELPHQLETPDDIAAAATELSRQARLLEDAGFQQSLS